MTEAAEVQKHDVFFPIITTARECTFTNRRSEDLRRRMEREISHHLSIFVLAHACGLLEDFTKEEINRKIQNSFGIIHPHFYVQETPTKKKEPGGII